MMNKEFKKGSIILVDFGETTECTGSVQKGRRPAMVLGSIKNSNKLTVVPLTSKMKRVDSFNHVMINKGEGNLKMDSMALVEDITTVSCEQIGCYIGFVSHMILQRINIAITKMLSLD